MRRLAGICVLVICVALLASTGDRGTASVAAPCASSNFSISASFPNDPGFEGLWKYTVTGSFDLGPGENGLSHISFLFNLDCPCACDIAGLVQFPSPAGTATGEDSLGAACSVDFLGLFECTGDPIITSPLPAIKYEAPEGQGCETTNTGTGTWHFYTGLSPLPDSTYADAVVIKYGVNECSGNLTGAFPDCTDCQSVGTEERSWGSIKKDYHE